MGKSKLWISDTEAVLYITCVLFIIGTVNIFSASFVMAGQALHDSYFFLKRHLTTFAIGLALMAVVVKIDYRRLKTLVLPMALVTLALLVAVKFIGLEANGARRWLHFGVTFQPSELAKLTSVFLSAAYLGVKIDGGRKATLLSPPVFIVGIMGYLVLKQPDLGTAAIIVGLCVALYLIAGIPSRQSYALVGLSAAAAVYLTLAAAYRAQRIEAWLNPWDFQDSTGYQIVQSLLAIGSGGLFGTGLGMGSSKFYYLPEAHTDFAFAILCQEMGFIGALIVFVLLGSLACYGGRIAQRASDGFGKMLALGVTLLIVGQGVANIAMVSGVLPVIGVPLPFISFGGTSLLVNMTGVALLMNVGRRNAAARPRRPDPAAAEPPPQKLRVIRKDLTQ